MITARRHKQRPGHPGGNVETEDAVVERLGLVDIGEIVEADELLQMFGRAGRRFPR